MVLSSPTEGPTLRLTWAGMDAAIDVIAAHCPRGLTAVCGMDRAGTVLAWALGERLELPVLRRPAAGALLVWGVATRRPRSRCAGVVHRAWVDMTPGYVVDSAMKATPGGVVLMPWQDATIPRREFIAGFDD